VFQKYCVVFQKHCVVFPKHCFVFHELFVVFADMGHRNFLIWLKFGSGTVAVLEGLSMNRLDLYAGKIYEKPQGI